MSKNSIIVVGGGIVGVMTALTLQRRGKSNFDRPLGAGHSRASPTDYNRVIRAISGRTNSILAGRVRHVKDGSSYRQKRVRTSCMNVVR